MAFSQSIRKGQAPLCCNLCEIETKISSKCMDCDLLMCTKCRDKVHPKFKNAKDYKIVDIKRHRTKRCKKSGKEQCKDTKEKIQAQNKALKTAVDEFTERMETKLEHEISLHQKSIEKERITTHQLKKKVEDQRSKLENIINAKDAAEVLKCRDEFQQSTSEEMELPKLNINLVPTFCPGELTHEVFGSLQNNISMKMTISEQFVVEVPRIDKILVCSDDSILISCQNKPVLLNKVKPEQGNLKDIHRIEKQVFDMAITQSQDILVSTGYSTLQLVNDKTGKFTSTKYSVAPLLIVGVHVTKSNKGVRKVIVGAISDWSPTCTPARSCIITMNATEHETIYEYDKIDTPIINFPWRIISTSNGRICILDRRSNDFNGQVVVFNEGNVIQVYKGQSKINSPDKPFKPTNFAVTPLDNIIITNLNMDIFHILNSSGHYITHYDTTDIGIVDPYSLCFGTTGLLYIGSTTRKGSNDKANLYTVNISEN
ncbi:unnamed protein product [Mytilus coruscus]|uniref:B box-type domain-containing protein n=1 Tax=Mytilus coruscus TaxID=42192 RepID=A0A6J8BI42_MYTCO|nr:unnamed protein product [Mytilus coruscus]